MNKSGKIVVSAAIAIATLVSIVAFATHLRESAEDSGNNGPENETPIQALKETLSGEASEANERGENEEAEAGK